MQQDFQKPKIILKITDWDHPEFNHFPHTRFPKRIWPDKPFHILL